MTALALTDLPEAPEARSVSRLLLVPAPRWLTRSWSPDDHPTRSNAVSTPTQEALPLEFCLPNGLPAVPAVPELVARHPSSSVVPWAARLAQAVLEVVAGERPVLQLTSWVHPDIYRRLERRHQLSTRQLDVHRPTARRADTVRSVRVCHPTDEVAEVCVITQGAERCLALAMRLERRKGRWFCTELDWA